MRDSCRACANSKVKCRREKPTCSRCAKRKVPCEYLPTKRGGRKSLRPRSPSLSDSAGGGNDDQIADHAARGRAASTSTAGSVTSAPARKGESGVSSSITVASQLPSPSLAGWFTPTESHHTATQAAPKAPMAALDSEPMQHSAFIPGASVHHFSGLFAQTPHQPISSDAPASMASVPSEMGQYLDASLAFLDLDMDLDLDTCEADFLDMGQVDFHGNTAFTWGLEEDMPLAPRSPSHDSDSHSGHGKASSVNMELNTTVRESASLTSATAVNPKKDSEVVKSGVPEPHSCSCMVQALGLTKQLFPLDPGSQVDYPRQRNLLA
ncbi:hypothetical protein PG993_013485 [Apiospora rasikravindrae]|uniref:Zn(2)-C6 fungal-type domain-containing protein n=1 Tax=Apiospora rasikravindrae TaxID=990691 RepID=A0ABR1RY96_9PEZI